MKVHVELEATPEEYRRLLGLPDVNRVNELYVDSLLKSVETGNFEQIQELSNKIAPMGQLGIKMFQQFMENSMAMAAMGNRPGSDKKE